jgi:hypothetical protein
MKDKDGNIIGAGATVTSSLNNGSKYSASVSVMSTNGILSS